jgi:hypothetical protein
VYVYLEPAPKEVYLDTISKPQHLIFGPIKKYITNKDRRGISFNLFPEQGDTIYIFVLADIDTLPEKCRVLQRYNLSINMDELKNRGGIISFPPTEEMKHVRMYPPYGTYNEEK